MSRRKRVRGPALPAPRLAHAHILCTCAALECTPRGDQHAASCPRYCVCEAGGLLADKHDADCPVAQLAEPWRTRWAAPWGWRIVAALYREGPPGGVRRR